MFGAVVRFAAGVVSPTHRVITRPRRSIGVTSPPFRRGRFDLIWAPSNVTAEHDSPISTRVSGQVNTHGHSLPQKTDLTLPRWRQEVGVALQVRPWLVSARKPLSDLPDFLDMCWRGSLSAIRAPDRSWMLRCLDDTRHSVGTSTR
jgi:hypothetical protein